ncbi:4'-phosphopantetheinyl transferase family protein [Burkholderia pseudomallei]|nr:4'-phosphopantetheinyl transferase family protein [Burkholderia pseudomallei]
MPARRRLFERHRMIGTRPSSMLGDRLGRSAASPHLDTRPRAARDCRRIPARRAFRRPCKGVVARGAHGKRGAARVASCVARIPLTARGRFGAWRGSLPARRKSSNVSLLRRGVIRSQRRPAAPFDSVGDAARCPRGDARDRIDPSPARTAAHRAHARAPRLRAAAAAVAAATAAGHCGCESAPRARRFAADRQEKGIARTHCAIARRAIST